jgi:hypothetical protein
MKPTTQSTATYQQSELRFILVNGVLKRGTLFAVIWFLCNYYKESADLLGLVYDSIVCGAVFGLATGLFHWHGSRRNSVKK